jgi:membrane protease YdiL (CAAX protease family)
MMRSGNVVILALAFEGALGAIGWALCAWLDVPLGTRLPSSSDVWLRSLVASLPMLLLLTFLTRSEWRPVAELRRQVEPLVGELFRGVSWLGLAVVAIAAGVGEEILFRGALQPMAERWWGAVAGLVLVSVLFGALHAASWAYFVLATLVGFYLGWLAREFDDLTTPIFVHAAYDFTALVVLRTSALRREPEIALSTGDATELSRDSTFESGDERPNSGMHSGA